MVHSCDTTTTNAAVMTHWGFHTVAFFAFFVENIIQEIDMAWVEFSLICIIIRLSYIYEFLK